MVLCFTDSAYTIQHRRVRDIRSHQLANIEITIKVTIQIASNDNNDNNEETKENW